jgi:RNA polymerase sigma-70 factor (ECF subfamily)
MPDKPELQLVTEFQNGDGEAIAELFRRHYPLSISVARRILPFGDEYSDAVQSAYVSAWRSIGSFRGESSFTTWITRIVTNQSLTHVRSSVRRKHFISLDDSGSEAGPVMVRDMAPTPEDLIQTAEVRKTLADAAANLPRPPRSIRSQRGFRFLDCGNRQGARAHRGRD